jgi:hypothetical protein
LLSSHDDKDHLGPQGKYNKNSHPLQLDQQAAFDILQILKVAPEGMHRPSSLSELSKTDIDKLSGYLFALDAWSGEKIPQLATLLRDAEKQKLVVVYVDDGDTPLLIEHPCLYCIHLGEKQTVTPYTTIPFDARSRLLDHYDWVGENKEEMERYRRALAALFQQLGMAAIRVIMQNEMQS